MEVSEARIRAAEDEHARMSDDLKENALSEVNRKAAEFHRGYTIAMRDILNGFYKE